jgi:hypothetical protein
MVELEYVKKRKRKKVVAIVSLISSVVVVAFVILAFIGKDLGNFTLEVKGNGAELALSEDSTFATTTSFYTVNKLQTFETYTIKSIPADDILDNEDSSDSLGQKTNSDGEVTALYYFKLTYFIKNVGDDTANYDLKLKLSENTKSYNTDSSLDEILRVRFYENTANSSTHNQITYAKATNTVRYDSDGNITDSECIGKETDGVCDTYASDTTGETTPFYDDETVFKRSYKGLKAGDYMRYTIVFWLEGEDPECKAEKPQGATLKLDMSYEAYVAEASDDTQK